MKKIFIIISLLPSLVLAEPNLQEAADDVCKCLKLPYEKIDVLVNRINTAKASGEPVELMPLYAKMISIAKDADMCFEKLPAKYPEIDKDVKLQDEVTKITEKQCPNPAKKL